MSRPIVDDGSADETAVGPPYLPDPSFAKPAMRDQLLDIIRWQGAALHEIEGTATMPATVLCGITVLLMGVGWWYGEMGGGLAAFGVLVLVLSGAIAVRTNRTLKGVADVVRKIEGFPPVA